jgi:hypothetical protein
LRCRFVVGERALILTLFLLGVSPPYERGTIVWLQIDCSIIISNGLVVVSFGFVGQATFLQSFDTVRLELESFI